MPCAKCENALRQGGSDSGKSSQFGGPGRVDVDAPRRGSDLRAGLWRGRDASGATGGAGRRIPGDEPAAASAGTGAVRGIPGGKFTVAPAEVEPGRDRSCWARAQEPDGHPREKRRGEKHDYQELVSGEPDTFLKELNDLHRTPGLMQCGSDGGVGMSSWESAQENAFFIRRKKLFSECAERSPSLGWMFSPWVSCLRSDFSSAVRARGTQTLTRTSWSPLPKLFR